MQQAVAGGVFCASGALNQCPDFSPVEKLGTVRHHVTGDIPTNATPAAATDAQLSRQRVNEVFRLGHCHAASEFQVVSRELTAMYSEIGTEVRGIIRKENAARGGALAIACKCPAPARLLG